MATTMSARNTRSQNFGRPVAPTTCDRCGHEFGEGRASKLTKGGLLVCAIKCFEIINAADTRREAVAMQCSCPTRPCIHRTN